MHRPLGKYLVTTISNTNFAELKKLKEAILAEDEHPMQAMTEREHIVELMDRIEVC